MTDRIVPPAESEYLVPFDGTFRIAAASTRPPAEGRRDKREERALLEERIERMAELQQRFFASDRHALLLVFQAMDAAGKDGTIRAVLSGVNPAGCQVSSFKKPSAEELDHDFLWRIYRALPERGRIGVFNRSHYEEVIVVRVHPHYLERQQLPGTVEPPAIFEERYQSLRDLELHLARNGTVIVKFFLHVSREEQKRRFLDRIDDPAANWKFNPDDIEESARFDDYMAAYERALNETSRAWAPWYAVPADDKPYMRRVVADVIVRTLEAIDPQFPTLSDAERRRIRDLRARIESE